MSDREPELRCVSCQAPLASARTAQGHDYQTCARCGGSWIENATLLAEIRAAQPQRRVFELMEHNDGTPRRPCPVCGETMVIAWLEFLQLDQCERHGVWLDAGERERALAGDLIPAEVAAALKGAEQREEARREAKDPPSDWIKPFGD